MNPTQPGGARPWQAPETWLALLLAACAVVSLFSVLPRMVGIDDYLHWVVGSAHAANEIGDVYAASEEERVGHAYLRRARQEVAQLGPDAQPKRRLQAAHVRARLDNFRCVRLDLERAALALVSVDLVMKLPSGKADPALCVVVGASALFALGLLDALRSTRGIPLPAG